MRDSELSFNASQCSASCGGGVQHRLIKCVNAKAEAGEVEAPQCDPALQPASTQKCNVQKCETTPSGELLWIYARIRIYTGIFTHLIHIYANLLLQLQTPSAAFTRSEFVGLERMVGHRSINASKDAPRAAGGGRSFRA